MTTLSNTSLALEQIWNKNKKYLNLDKSEIVLTSTLSLEHKISLLQLQLESQKLEIQRLRNELAGFRNLL
jgi:hypothetical protein